jgi:hypothetical protein
LHAAVLSIHVIGAGTAPMLVKIKAIPASRPPGARAPHSRGFPNKQAPSAVAAGQSGKEKRPQCADVLDHNRSSDVSNGCDDGSCTGGCRAFRGGQLFSTLR